jgi:hypothetical protein
MFSHKCKIDDMVLIGDRPNPFNTYWLPWALAKCKKCGAIQEWQIHSEEAMHGGALECTAHPELDYIKLKYKITEHEIQQIMNGKKEPMCFDYHTQQYETPK